MTDEEKENIKYRLSDLGVKVGELALEYISDLEKENEMLREEIRVLRRNCESDELALNESKEILAELKEKIKDLREFADKLSEAHADEWEKQQEIITELKELHESDKRSVGIIVKTAKDEIDKYKEQLSCYKEKINDVYNVCDIVLDGATNWDEEQLDEFFEQVGRIVGYGRKEKTDVT